MSIGAVASRLPLGWALYVGVNLALISMLRFGPGDPSQPLSVHADWRLWSSLPQSIAAGTMYESRQYPPFVWSPIAGWFMALVPTVIGYWPWFAAHVIAVFALRDPKLIVLVLASWGFWIDASGGNVFGFIFIAGVLAYGGSRAAAIVYLALLFLMPRPIQAPLALWLLCKMPEVRLPAAALFVAHAVVVLASGYAFDWLSAMTDIQLALADPQPNAGNLAPSAFIGQWWIVVGLPIGTWLLWQGRVGLAGLAWSPYWLPAYLLMPLTTFRPGRSSPRRCAMHRPRH